MARGAVAAGIMLTFALAPVGHAQCYPSARSFKSFGRLTGPSYLRDDLGGCASPLTRQQEGARQITQIQPESRRRTDATANR